MSHSHPIVPVVAQGPYLKETSTQSLVMAMTPEQYPQNALPELLTTSTLKQNRLAEFMPISTLTPEIVSETTLPESAQKPNLQDNFSTPTPEVYSQSTVPESLPTSSLEPNPYSQDASLESLPISTLTPEVSSQSTVPEFLPSTLIADLQSPSLQSIPKITDAQELHPRKITPQSLPIHLKTASARFTVIQESLPKPEIPGRILVHSRIVIEGGKGINLIIYCLVNSPSTEKAVESLQFLRSYVDSPKLIDWPI